MKKNRFDKRAPQNEEVELLLVEDEDVIIEEVGKAEGASEDVVDEKGSDVLDAGELADGREESVETLGGAKDASVGKSFRSRDLTASDLEQKKVSATFEDKWVDEDTGSEWVLKFVLLCVVALTSAGLWAFFTMGEDVVDDPKEETEKLTDTNVVDRKSVV